MTIPGATLLSCSSSLSKYNVSDEAVEEVSIGESEEAGEPMVRDFVSTPRVVMC